MSLLLHSPGLHALVVDGGRPGWRALGVPAGGAADRAALAIGNALVGNPPESPAVEFTLAGPTLRAAHPAACAVFGAPFRVAVNARPVAAGTTFALRPGDELRITGTDTGVRGYLCVAGGFDAPEVLGSRSSLDPLQAGTELPCPASWCEPRGLPFAALPHDGPGRDRVRVLRVLDGPQRDWFTDDRFFTGEYTVSPASNRMGLRLTGPALARRPGELVSEAVAPGAVQVTNDGLPVVLGVDGQTIGGYPKVAHVVRADLDALAQLRPGDRVRFALVSLDEANIAARGRAAAVRVWLARLAAAERRPVIG